MARSGLPPRRLAGRLPEAQDGGEGAVGDDRRDDDDLDRVDETEGEDGEAGADPRKTVRPSHALMNRPNASSISSAVAAFCGTESIVSKVIVSPIQ